MIRSPTTTIRTFVGYLSWPNVRKEITCATMRPRCSGGEISMLQPCSNIMPIQMLNTKSLTSYIYVHVLWTYHSCIGFKACFVMSGTVKWIRRSWRWSRSVSGPVSSARDPVTHRTVPKSCSSLMKFPKAFSHAVSIEKTDHVILIPSNQNKVLSKADTQTESNFVEIHSKHPQCVPISKLCILNSIYSGISMSQIIGSTHDLLFEVKIQCVDPCTLNRLILLTTHGERYGVLW